MRYPAAAAWILTLAIVAASGSAWAEGRPGIWITPFGGFRLSGSVPLSDPTYSKLDIEDNPVYGMAVGMEVFEGVVEVMWSHQDTQLRAVPINGSPLAGDRFNLNTDQVHFNGLFLPAGYAYFQPFAIGGLGFTRYSPSGDSSSVNRFSWALGGGVMVPFTKRLSLRLEAKWNPALMSSSSSIFCNSATGQCFVSSSGELINQFDFTGGLTLRL